MSDVRRHLGKKPGTWRRRRGQNRGGRPRTRPVSPKEKTGPAGRPPGRISEVPAEYLIPGRRPGCLSAARRGRRRARTFFGSDKHYFAPANIILLRQTLFCSGRQYLTQETRRASNDNLWRQPRLKNILCVRSLRPATNFFRRPRRPRRPSSPQAPGTAPTSPSDNN
jgi:hypothetical protein